MGHRNFSNYPFNEFATNQGHDQNHLPVEHSYTSLGRTVVRDNGSYIHPIEGILRGGENIDSQLNPGSRPYHCPSSNFGMEAPLFPPPVSCPPYGSFSHSATTGNFYLPPGNSAGVAQCSYYDRPTMHAHFGGIQDSAMGAGRGTLKRKSPGIFGPCERGNTSRFYDAGSSSGSSEILLEKPTSDYQIVPSGPISFPPYNGSSFSAVSEGSLRNVRSRTRLDFDPSTSRTHISGYSSGPSHSTTHPTNFSRTLDVANPNVDPMTQGWNCIPLSAAARERIPISDTTSSSHETNCFLVGGGTTEIHGYHYESIQNRYPVSSSQYLRAPASPTSREGHINYSGRAMHSYGAGPSYSNVGHGAVSSDTGLHSLSESSYSRISRPYSAGGRHNSYRDGRPRIASDRFQSISSLADARDRLRSGALMMLDHSPSYTVHQFDEYQDMMLDIDSMSYEELLALGERIGNVSTGLSESMISSCLKETVYHPSDQNHDEGTCAICLEEYKNDEEVGTLKSCGHDHHVGCIRKWLSMKNVCPICKAAAFTESSKQE